MLIEKGITNNEKIVLDRIKKIINDNREFSLGVAEVEINNILNEDLNLSEKIRNIKVKDNE